LVEKISKISASAAPIATRIEHSISVAEPEIAWAARRQAEIDEGLEDRRKSGEHPHPESNAEDAGSRHLDLHHSESPEQTDDAEKLSGESERIGTGNLDEEDVPFGEHSGYI